MPILQRYLLNWMEDDSKYRFDLLSPIVSQQACSTCCSLLPQDQGQWT
jgi:hypothetical protein